MLKSGSRWRDCPDVYGPYTTVYNRFNRWSRQGIWTDIFYALTGSTGMYGSMSSSSYIKTHRSRRPPRGPSTMQLAARRRNTKIHALTDDIGRPLAFLITPGNTHDLVGARGLIGMVRNPRRLLADRAYDARSLRDELAARRIKAVIPPNPTRKHPHRYDKTAYKGRNVIERMFCRLKDFRRIATRYDRRTLIDPSTQARSQYSLTSTLLFPIRQVRHSMHRANGASLFQSHHAAGQDQGAS